MKTQNTRLLIIGSGPAGYTAAIYAVRAGIETTLIAGTQVGGQLTITDKIENFPGFPEPISGQELMDRMKKQAENLGTKIIQDTIKSVDLSKRPFTCIGESKTTYKADGIIIATGARARFLGLPNEKQLVGFGVSVCATCDGFFYRNKNVAIIGGGNTALTDADLLAKLAKSVTIVHRRDTFKADKVLVEKVIQNKNIQFEYDSAVEAILSSENPLGVTGLKIKNLKTNQTKDISVDGVFLAIGREPQTDLFKGQLEINEFGFIKTNADSTKTSVKGVFAAGDVQSPMFQQAITAAASGCQAALEADKFLCTVGCDKD